jgi:small subunit ribosomal protein S16
MAVRLRLKRAGRRHRPFYRVAAMDIRSPRDGRVIEELGFYDPLAKEDARRVSLKRDRVEHWLSVGAQPSETVRSLLRQGGIAVKSPKKAKAAKTRTSKADGDA